MRTARALLQITRPDSSLLAFLCIMLPMFIRTQDFSLSIERSVSVLFISMCTFIVNDLDDIEKDKINHPERPLPSGQVSPLAAATLYFACLGLSLLTVRAYISESRVAFWYYLLLAMTISYGYIVEYIPVVKPFYVAIAVAIPVMIVQEYFPRESALTSVALAVALFSLGRELCMDLRDRLGDRSSLLHKIPPKSMANIAFLIQAIAIFSVSRQSAGIRDCIAVLLMAALLLMSYICWFFLSRKRMSTGLMKLALVVGLQFTL